MIPLCVVPGYGAASGNSGSLQIFGLLSPPTGSVSMVATTTTSAGSLFVSTDSVAYSDVAGWGVPSFGTTSAAVFELPVGYSLPGMLIAAAFTGSGSTTAALFSGNIRNDIPYVSGNHSHLVMGDVAIGYNPPALVSGSMPTTINQADITIPLLPPSQVGTAPAYDATGAGNAVSATSMTWSHNATAGAYVVVAISVYGNFSINSVLYNGVLMYQLPSSLFNNTGTDGCVFMFGLNNVPGGSKTVTVNLSGSTFASGNSVSYTGVGSVTGLFSPFGTTLPTQAILAGSYSRVVQVFGWQSSTTQPATTGGTNRAIQGYSSSPNFLADLTINDSVGPTTFANSLTTVNWGGCAAILNPVQSWAPAVTFEAVATGSATTTAVTTATTTWTHTTNGGSTAAVVVYLAVAMNEPYSSIACSYAGTAMTYLGGAEYFNSGGVQYVIFQFGVIGPPPGASTVSATLTVSTTGGSVIIAGNSLSYMNVGTFGLFEIFGTTGTNLSTSGQAATGQVLLTAFSSNQNSVLSGFTQTLRSNQPDGLSTNSPPLMIGDAAGSGPSTGPGNTINFNATQSVSGAWGAITLQLLPIG